MLLLCCGTETDLYNFLGWPLKATELYLPKLWSQFIVTMEGRSNAHGLLNS